MSRESKISKADRLKTVTNMGLVGDRSADDQSGRDRRQDERNLGDSRTSTACDSED